MLLIISQIISKNLVDPSENRESSESYSSSKVQHAPCFHTSKPSLNDFRILSTLPAVSPDTMDDGTPLGNATVASLIPL